MKYTKKQGQYLSFIYYYRKLNNESPAHSDFQKYFVMPRNPLFIEHLHNSSSLQEADAYEQYCLKHYDPSRSLVSSKSYRIKRYAI